MQQPDDERPKGARAFGQVETLKMQTDYNPSLLRMHIREKMDELVLKDSSAGRRITTLLQDKFAHALFAENDDDTAFEMDALSMRECVCLDTMLREMFN